MAYRLCGFSGNPLPKLCGTIALSRADKTALAVLICLAQSDENATPESIARDCGCNEEEVEAALAYWEKYRIISQVDSGDFDALAFTEVPQSDSAFAELVHECAEIIGITDANFSELGDIEVLRRMAAKYDFEFIVCLTKYYKEEKKGDFSFAYIEKVAHSLSKEKGINDAISFLKYIDNKTSLEGAARRLFGLGSTMLSKNQSKLIEKWTLDYGYDREIFGRAYDIMADCATKRSFNYIDKILTHWHSENCRTAEDVNRLLSKESEERTAKIVGNVKQKPQGTKIRIDNKTFDPEEAFARALKRSEEKMNKIEKEKKEGNVQS